MIEVPFSDRKQIGQLQKKLREGYARIAELEREWEHVARHLAAICDEWDECSSLDDLGKQIHQASAYLLAAGRKKPQNPDVGKQE